MHRETTLIREDRCHPINQDGSDEVDGVEIGGDYAEAETGGSALVPTKTPTELVALSKLAYLGSMKMALPERISPSERIERTPTYEASMRTFPCISSTRDEMTALRPLVDSCLHLMITNWSERSELVFHTKCSRCQLNRDAPDQL